jgi:hypothetical protein
VFGWILGRTCRSSLSDAKSSLGDAKSSLGDAKSSLGLRRLGAFHVKSELYEKAMPYFDLASKIQPQEVKWLLMVASCHRRIGAPL